MSESKRRLWPFGSRASLFLATVLAVRLLLLVLIFHATTDWLGAQSESAVLIGILMLSLLPIGLAFLGADIDRCVRQCQERGPCRIDLMRVEKLPSGP